MKDLLQSVGILLNSISIVMLLLWVRRHNDL